jgi:hypothetical protein
MHKRSESVIEPTQRRCLDLRLAARLSDGNDEQNGVLDVEGDHHRNDVAKLVGDQKSHFVSGSV